MSDVNWAKAWENREDLRRSLQTLSDQEIRAHALECACRLFSGCMKDPESAAAFDGCKAEFEDYIRNGK